MYKIGDEKGYFFNISRKITKFALFFVQYIYTLDMSLAAKLSKSPSFTMEILYILCFQLAISYEDKRGAKSMKYEILLYA